MAITSRFKLLVLDLVGRKVFPSQSAVAEHLGLTPQQMTNLVKGRQQVQLWMIHRLCNENAQYLNWIFYAKGFGDLDGKSPIAAEESPEYSVVHRADPVVHRFSMDEWMADVERRLKELENKD